MFTAKLTFWSFDEKKKVTLVVSGIHTLEQAMNFGHHRAAQISAEKGKAFWLCEVYVNAQTFVCLPTPGFYAEDVRELSRKDSD